MDTQNQTFTFSSNGKEYAVIYSLKEDGTLKYDTGNFMTGSNKFVVYKDGSKAIRKQGNKKMVDI